MNATDRMMELDQNHTDSEVLDALFDVLFVHQVSGATVAPMLREQLVRVRPQLAAQKLNVEASTLIATAEERADAVGAIVDAANALTPEAVAAGINAVPESFEHAPAEQHEE